MPDRNSDGQGRIVERGTVRIERLLPGPADRVWTYLTQSQMRRQWLAVGEMEPRVGGRVEHLFRHAELSAEPTPERYRKFDDSPAMFGEVTQWDPPRVLAYTWPGDDGSSEVTFELFPEQGEVLLILTHRRLPDTGTMVSVASGWDSHVGILIDRLKGTEPRGFWSTHERLEQRYLETFAATTADGTKPEHVVRLERVFDASPEALYAAWTDLDLMRRWLGRSVDADVRVGGRFRIESDGDEGEVYIHSGEYLALEPGKLVKQTFVAEGHDPYPYADEFIAISFRALPDGDTQLTLVNGWNGDGPGEDGAELVRQGWTLWLDLLDGMFERSPELRRTT
ncbi:SRPBCC domain-containing protein [Mesorhizobium sp. CAU 1732]|uniref:SRPBCC domain-containing protein n=1 Tax=Mesorhizobium sp. CAU 1732 TaxID=3140358 RepID=UPI003261204E